jgi:hypothetical protein
LTTESKLMSTTFSRLERDTRRRGAFFPYWDSNAFALQGRELRLALGKRLCYVMNMN